jgi:hypothetical protein
VPPDWKNEQSDQTALMLRCSAQRMKLPVRSATRCHSRFQHGIHDLRRTVATGLQRLGVPMPVTEKVLNHVSGSHGGIAGVYQRHEYASEKRAALEAWSNLVTTIVNNKISR